MLNEKNEIIGTSPIMTRWNKILIVLAVILAVLYVLSFTKSCSSKDSREKIKTSLVNQKYKDSITSFELEDATGAIKITNRGSFWTVGTLPASSERMHSFINNLIKVRNLYKISDKINKNSTLGLTTGTEFHLRYKTQDTSHELIFGNQDFSLSSRYMMTEKSTQVYEIDSSLDSFLTTSIQSWAEPLIISQLVFEKITPDDIQRTTVLNQNHISSISDLQKLLDLRHGGTPDEEEVLSIFQNNQKPETTITLELGNKKEIELKIYPSKNENEFILIAEYKPEKGTNPVFTSISKISSWTYNKIKENTL